MLISRTILWYKPICINIQSAHSYSDQSKTATSPVILLLANQQTGTLHSPKSTQLHFFLLPISIQLYFFLASQSNHFTTVQPSTYLCSCILTYFTASQMLDSALAIILISYYSPQILKTFLFSTCTKYRTSPHAKSFLLIMSINSIVFRLAQLIRTQYGSNRTEVFWLGVCQSETLCRLRQVQYVDSKVNFIKCNAL